LLAEQSQVAAEPSKVTYLSESPVKAKVFYVNALGLDREDRYRIDFGVSYMTRDYVVVLRENVEAPGIQLLLDELRFSLRTTAARLPQLSCAL
jgi:hypothetical protein